MKRERKRFPKLLALLILTAVLLSSFVSCYTGEYVADFLCELDVPDFDEAKFKKVERYCRDYYVKDLPSPEELAAETAKLFSEAYGEEIDTGDVQAVTSALINCYLYAVGDMYAVYRTPEEYKDYNTGMSGTFYGIGVLVSYSAVEKTITVSEVYSGGGAQDAGIEVGDIIVGVNGYRVSDIGYNAAVGMIRGEENTTVNITVLRGNTEITVTATRKKVVEESVSYSINENKIGYIKISSFKDNTHNQFLAALDFMEENGAVAIIYDVRSNPGGYLSSVVNSLSYVSESGTTIVSFSNNYSSARKDSNSMSVNLPSVIICDENTASAGELFTAAMRDFDEVYGYFEVTVVGETTFGKGVMQSTFPLGDGSTLTLTVAYYNPPSGENYDGVGITPDVIVESSDEGDAQLTAAYEEIYKMIN